MIYVFFMLIVISVTLQYIMLAGCVPFHGTSDDVTPDTIIKNIQQGELSGPEWETVSDSGKDLINGLLTVDPQRRLNMTQLLRHRWFYQHDDASSLPLKTPETLDRLGPDTVQVECNKVHMAFIQARRDGCFLKDVDSAPLVKRRKINRNSSDKSPSCKSSSIKTSVPPDACTDIPSLPTKDQSQTDTYPVSHDCVTDTDRAPFVFHSLFTDFAPIEVEPVNLSPTFADSDIVVMDETDIAATIEISYCVEETEYQADDVSDVSSLYTSSSVDSVSSIPCSCVPVPARGPQPRP